MEKRVSVQQRMVWISIALMAAKFAAYFLTFSVSILTDAMESIVNVVAGVISLYSLRLAVRPKDKNHPFGHGKVEFVSASIEGLMIAVAGVMIVYEAVMRWYTPVPVQKLDIGIMVVMGAAVVNYMSGAYCIKVGKSSHSMALIASGKHLQSDTYSSLGITVGLIVMYFTDMVWIDSLLAMVFGAVIVGTGVGILKKTVSNLMDKADPEALEALAQVVESGRKEDWVDLHNAKLLKYGGEYFMDCDLTLPYYYTIVQGHEAGETLKRVVEERSDRPVRLSVHFDPCTPEQCTACMYNVCTHRSADLQQTKVFSAQHIVESDE